MSNNPLYTIFFKNNQGELTEELENINNINFFFNYIIDDKVKDEEKIIILKELESKIKVNRYISAFFSSFNNKSIYIYLFDLYSNKNISQNLKEVIINLIKELLFNIQTGKEIYEYIFQKLAQIYRGEIQRTENNLYTYLILLKTIFKKIESRPPKNYFACSGNCQFNVNLNKLKLEVGYSFSFNLNFKISNYHLDEKIQVNNRISNLVELYFDNKNLISIDLQYPFFLVVKKIRKDFIKILPLNEWINLIITIVVNKNDIIFYFLVNGENNNIPHKIENFGLKHNTIIKHINFFNNFYGEVSSILMFSYTEPGNPGTTFGKFLSKLKDYSEGLWKKKKIKSFLKLLTNYESMIKEPGNTEEKKKTLFDNLLFIFSPINTSNRRPSIVEDIFSKFQMKYSGNIRIHKYKSYQKRLSLLGGFGNFYPIAEMFLIYPEISTGKNFEIFLETISNIINSGKNNLKIISKNKLFKILSMFMEKYPNKLYTENVLNILISLAKSLFTNDLVKECSNFFNYILLNEKILSKYSDNLQCIFWEKLFFFCQTDITLFKTFLNINRLSIILRFYDKNKFKEMCCQKHLDDIKDEYIGSHKIMNPTLNTKLSRLKDIMNIIIDSIEPNNSLVIFKLLTLDLSPCLTLFIINIFIQAFDKLKNEEWKNSFVKHLIDAKFEIIIFNTFIHSLPDVRIELLKLIFQIHNRLVICDKINNITTLNEMIKTCLLPENMFYSEKKISLNKEVNIINGRAYKYEETNIQPIISKNKKFSIKESYDEKYSQKQEQESNEIKNVKQENISRNESSINNEDNKTNKTLVKENIHINEKEEDKDIITDNNVIAKNKELEELKNIDNIVEESLNEENNIIEVNKKFERNKILENIKSNNKNSEETKIIKENKKLFENEGKKLDKQKEFEENKILDETKNLIPNKKLEENIILENKILEENKILIENEKLMENKNSDNNNEFEKNQKFIENKNEDEHKILNVHKLMDEKIESNEKRINEENKDSENIKIKDNQIADENKNEEENKIIEEIKILEENKIIEDNKIFEENKILDTHKIIANNNEETTEKKKTINEKNKLKVNSKEDKNKSNSKNKKKNNKHDFEALKDFRIKEEEKDFKNLSKQKFLDLVSTFEKHKQINKKQKKDSLKLVNKENPFWKLIENQKEEKKKKGNEKVEKERIDKKILEKEKIEKERIEKERIEEKRIKKERLEKEREGNERLEKEKLEKEKIEIKRIEEEKIEKERLEKERDENEKNKEEQYKQEKINQEKIKGEIFEKEKLEKITEDNYSEKKNNERKIVLKEKKIINGKKPIYVRELILKETIYNEYIEKLYTIFILWIFAIDISIPISAIYFKDLQIINLNGIEFLFLLNKRIKNKSLFIFFLSTFIKIIDVPENAYIIFSNIKIFSSFLEVAFNNYKLDGNDDIKCFTLCKNIMIKSFINSFAYCYKNLPNIYPCKNIEILFIWGNKTIQENNEIKENVNDFLYEIIIEFMLQYKMKYDPKIKSNSVILYDANKNFFLKNYLYFIRCIFDFIFRYRLDEKIYINGPEIYNNKSFKIIIENAFINSMRLTNKNSSNKIEELWKDFPLINEIITKTKYIWSKKNCFKGIKMDNYKKNKIKKCDFIIENIIIDKDKKNIYQKELEFLCLEEKNEQIELIIPFIKIIPLGLIGILSKLKDLNNDKEFNFWLKELKYFLLFLIISSTNLNKNNQLELYNDIQKKTLESIFLGFCFLHYLLSTELKEKNKIEKDIVYLFLLSFKILKYQSCFDLNQKKNFNFSNKSKVINIEDCAICMLFGLNMKDKEINLFPNLNCLEKLELGDNNYYKNILDIITNSDFISAFFENKNLLELLEKNIYSLSEYKLRVIKRYSFIPKLADVFNDSYKRTILFLLPKYENDLAQYSNNSLERNIKIKKKYKIYKKIVFSWRGYWSCRDNFYKNIFSFKLKIINHYTKNFMKPILKPIIDFSYYLPEFSGFDPKQLFFPDSQDNIFKLNMDIDKILKESENNNKENIFNDDNINLEENYLVNIYKNSNQELYKKLLNISNNLEFSKKEEFFLVQKDNSKETEKNYFLTCLVKTSHHIKGVIFIDNKKLNFKVFMNQKTGNSMNGVDIGFTTEDHDYDQDRKTCFGSFVVCNPKDKDLYKISINYNDIKWIFKRKYYYYNSALEIFTTTNKTYYFNFKYEDERTSVLNEILNKLDGPIQIIDDLKDPKLDCIIGYENGAIQKQKNMKKKVIKLSKIVKSWKNWEISNFEFLMWLNIFGNRSYNDISQYPIFPWILINYEDPLKVKQNEEKEINENDVKKKLRVSNIINNTNYLANEQLNPQGNNNEQNEKIVIDYLYRDMNLPMGMLEINDEASNRKKDFCMHYKSLLECEDELIKPYVFGSNYSNPIYVCNFLMRLFPFTYISIELQGKGFDDPNRLFISVKDSFINSSTQEGDVREIIPEFFYLPEMFKNINKLNMGKLANGERVNDVLTPCKNNSYDFIMTMRNCLESNNISYKLHEWINLIFGFKQRGKEAEKANNIYKESCYQEIIDINNLENKSDKLREAEFGLVPNQLMIKECSKKEKKDIIKKGKLITGLDCDLRHYQCKFDIEKNILKEIEGLNLVKAASFSQDKLLLLLGGSSFVEIKISYSIFDKPSNCEILNKFEINQYCHKMKEFYNPEKPDSKVMKFCHKGRTVIFGGFYDGKIVIKSTLSEQKTNYKIDIPFIDNSPIVALEVDQDDEFAFFGNEMGNIRIMKLNANIKESKMDILISDHLSSISHIHCNSDLNLWISASTDGYINLYTLPLSKLIRSLKVDTPYCNYAFLSSSPLPSIIVIGEDNNTSEIFIYSINGVLYLRQKEQYFIKNPLILKDINSNEYLAYIINKSIIIKAIPTLFMQTSIEDIPNLFSICLSNDQKTLFAIDRTGRYIEIIKNSL